MRAASAPANSLRPGLRDIEMGSARDAVEHVQVVGQYARIEQRAGQIGERVRVVVDAFQKHRLVEQCDAIGVQRGAGLAYGVVDLVRMIRVQNEYNWPR